MPSYKVNLSDATNINPRRRLYVEKFEAWLEWHGRKQILDRTSAAVAAEEIDIDVFELWIAVHDAYALGIIAMRQRGETTVVELIEQHAEESPAAPAASGNGRTVHVQQGASRGRM